MLVGWSPRVKTPGANFTLIPTWWVPGTSCWLGGSGGSSSQLSSMQDNFLARKVAPRPRLTTAMPGPGSNMSYLKSKIEGWRDIFPERWRPIIFRFYGKTVFQVVQEPGEVLYLPHGYPHTIHNVDDNIALTNNYLFPDAIRPLVKALRLKIISESAELAGWSEETALHNLYMTSSRDTREQIRDTVQRITRLQENYKDFSD